MGPRPNGGRPATRVDLPYFESPPSMWPAGYTARASSPGRHATIRPDDEPPRPNGPRPAPRPEHGPSSALGPDRPAAGHPGPPASRPRGSPTAPAAAHAGAARAVRGGPRRRRLPDRHRRPRAAGVDPRLGLRERVRAPDRDPGPDREDHRRHRR